MKLELELSDSCICYLQNQVSSGTYESIEAAVVAMIEKDQRTSRVELDVLAAAQQDQFSEMPSEYWDKLRQMADASGTTTS